jgi:hypothetical protein
MKEEYFSLEENPLKIILRQNHSKTLFNVEHLSVLHTDNIVVLYIFTRVVQHSHL